VPFLLNRGKLRFPETFTEKFHQKVPPDPFLLIRLFGRSFIQTFYKKVYQKDLFFLWGNLHLSFPKRKGRSGMEKTIVRSIQNQLLSGNKIL